MPKKVQMSGNEAVANALRQINPDVFPMFPITPSTEIPQYFANMHLIILQIMYQMD